MVTLSTEQFEAILESVGVSNERGGTFSSCSSRYNGDRNPVKVEEFIAAIFTFKIVEKVNDADAINGMSILFEGDAAEWWNGVKDQISTFTEVIRMLREGFTKPAWRIYAEIIKGKQQRGETTDTFIRKKRALFAQLPNKPAESDQIDMLFGMLRADIRERVSRPKVTSYEQLVNEAREAELFLSERENLKKHQEKITYCHFCQKTGHTLQTCFMKQPSDAYELSTVATPTSVVCYGCNAPGVVRANCAVCRQNQKPASETIIFNSLSPLNVGLNTRMLLVNVQILGVSGQAYFDTAARTSILSAHMKREMDAKGCLYLTFIHDIASDHRGVYSINCRSTRCNMVIGGRCLYIQFLIPPHADHTLLGADFLEQSGIILNMGQGHWYFDNNPTQHFDFVEIAPGVSEYAEEI